MNRSMLIGVAAGIAMATAGGVVAGYQLFGKPAASESVAEIAPDSGSAIAPEPQAPASRSPQPGLPVAGTGTTAAAPVAAPPVAPVTVQEECWDEEVVVQAEPRDEHRIAGTAIGAAVGGAVARDLGDRDLTTAVGAAAGAVAGRRIQRRIQENRTTTIIEQRCAPVSTR